MDKEEVIEQPRKRLKTDDAPQSDSFVFPTSEGAQKQAEASATAQLQPSTEDAQALKEAEVGITEFVSSDVQGFSGILKKRYTDFLVNEILPSGEVLHLRNQSVPESVKQESKSGDVPPVSGDSQPAAQPSEGQQQNEDKPADANAQEKLEFHLSDEDKSLLESYYGSENTQKILALHDRVLASPKARPGELGRVKTTAITDRDLRIQIHQAIRRIFSSRLESSTDAEGVMTISAAPKSNRQDGRTSRGNASRQPKGKVGWDELGGPYLHFTIYKENKDTMEVISYLARQLKMNAKSFQFAGTKDRRGVTVQRACVYRVHAERLAGLSKTLRNATLGDYEYRKHGLELGDLGGNEFVITLRECEFPGVDLKDTQAAIASASQIVEKALRDLRERGYFNYYGLQRFGTFATRTDTVGVKMLQGDFKGACEAILHFSPHILAAAQGTLDSEGGEPLISTDDKARAEAIHIFQTTGKINDALDKLPRKFSAEANLIRHLGRSKNDYVGALQTIPRNLRLMYVHAYQSLVWNYAAGERWRLYGDKVVEGDLVIIKEHLEKNGHEESGKVDADGEVIIDPQAEDSANAADDMFTRARALTAEEAASGKYSIFDVVLPLPGFDILYPPNKMTNFYKRFMGSEQGGGLDPFDMRRKWKDISLSGSYRKLLSRPGPDYSFEVKSYSNYDQQFVQTDLDRLSKAGDSSDSTAESGDKLAVILKFQLGSSQYATMALRELMKGAVKTYKPDFGGGR